MLINDRNSRIILDLEKSNLICQKKVFEHYLAWQSRKPTPKLIEKVQKMQQYICVTFTLTRHLFPPYEVVKSDD